MKARNNDFLAKYENYPLRNEIQEGILLQSVCVRLIQLEMLTLNGCEHDEQTATQSSNTCIYICIKKRRELKRQTDKLPA